MVSNKGKKGLGTDGELWQVDKAKMEAARRLYSKIYHARPLRRIYIEKYRKKKKRTLGILTMSERAMQALQFLVLEPVGETTADRISFGLWRYRSPENAREYAFCVLSRKNSPQWILEGDLKNCFDKISYQWMPENIPTEKGILKEFMKCGYIEKGELFPITEDSSQEGIILLTYVTVILDGMSL